MLIGAWESNADLDIEGALEMQAAPGTVMPGGRSPPLTSSCAIVTIIGHLITSRDHNPDLQGADGFRDDVAELHRLQAFLGYV